MAKYMNQNIIYFLPILMLLSCFSARRDFAKLSVLNIDLDHLTKLDVNNKKQQRAFYVDSASVIIPENYIDTSWNNYVGTTIKLIKSENIVLFIDAFISPGAIDLEYGYKFILEIPRKSFSKMIIFNQKTEYKAFAHYFHYGGDIKCWYFNGYGYLKLNKITKDSIQSELNVTFLPDSTCDRFVSHQINIAGNSTLPINHNLDLFNKVKP